MRALITDDLSPAALEVLEDAGVEADVQLGKSAVELRDLAQGAQGWIVRSGTRITSDLIEAADALKVIGRAGVGVDNIDIEAATRRGVLVVNAPDGNTTSTAEHTCAMILALVRHIPQAARSLSEGAWDRKRFQGAELDGKTLGVVGVGKVGRAVAARMQAFGMQTIGFDPVLGPEVAEQLRIASVPLEQIWAESDVISFHAPLNDSTRNLLNAETLSRCRRGVRVVNIARGGIVDEGALLAALDAGEVAGAALDVYSQEPPPAEMAALLAHPAVVATPHIAASTEEAQRKVAVQIANEVVRALRGEPVSTAVNASAIGQASRLGAAPYILLAERLGALGAQVVHGPLERVRVEIAGEAILRHADVLPVAALVGLMGRWSEAPMNLVNAPLVARETGLRVEETRSSDGGEFSNLVSLTLTTPSETRTVRGTIVRRNEIRLVGFDDYLIEVPLEGHLLFYQNVDRPGMLAAVGALLAEAGVNIGGLSLGRKSPGAMALTALAVDGAVPRETLARMGALSDVEQIIVASV